jgi:hypothetical protein
MIIIIGLVILVVTAIAGLEAVLGNAGHGHALTTAFSMLGYHVTGSTGALFLYGIVVGAVAMLGLALLLGGARRSSRRGTDARRSLRQSRRETTAVSQDRDDLMGQRDDLVRASTASTPADGTPADSGPADGSAGPSSAGVAHGRGSWLRGLGLSRRPAPRPVPVSRQAAAQPTPLDQGTAADQETGADQQTAPDQQTTAAPANQPAPDVPAGDPASV